MNKYETYDNFDPVWLVDRTEYPQKKQTFRYSESTMKRYSDYHYKDCKGLIRIKEYDADYLFIMDVIEKNGAITKIKTHDLLPQTYAQNYDCNYVRKQSDYELIIRKRLARERKQEIESRWDF